MSQGALRTEPDPRRWWALGLLCGAFFMVILDAAIVTVALPSIEQDLGFSAQGLQWVVSAYALTFAGLLLLGGAPADLSAQARCGLVRAPASLHGRRLPLHRRLPPLRARLVGWGADRGACLPGGGGGDHDPDRALDHHEHLRGGGRA